MTKNNKKTWIEKTAEYFNNNENENKSIVGQNLGTVENIKFTRLSEGKPKFFGDIFIPNEEELESLKAKLSK